MLVMAQVRAAAPALVALAELVAVAAPGHVAEVACRRRGSRGCRPPRRRPACVIAPVGVGHVAVVLLDEDVVARLGVESSGSTAGACCTSVGPWMTRLHRRLLQVEDHQAEGRARRSCRRPGRRRWPAACRRRRSWTAGRCWLGRNLRAGQRRVDHQDRLPVRCRRGSRA